MGLLLGRRFRHPEGQRWARRMDGAALDHCPAPVALPEQRAVCVQAAGRPRPHGLRVWLAVQLRKALRALLFVAPLGPAPSVAETPLADLFDTCVEVVESRSETPALPCDLLPLNQGTWHARVETPLGPVSLSISKEDGEAGEVLSCDVTGADTRVPIRSWRSDITLSEALDEIIHWGRRETRPRRLRRHMAEHPRLAFGADAL